MSLTYILINTHISVSHKTPTCVLLKPDASFYKFGYEAEDRYNEIAESDDENHKDYYFFRRFKMVLHSRPVRF
jgi:sarcosine oxidase delta subunit